MDLRAYEARQNSFGNERLGSKFHQNLKFCLKLKNHASYNVGTNDKTKSPMTVNEMPAGEGLKTARISLGRIE